jgi:surface antigen
MKIVTKILAVALSLCSGLSMAAVNANALTKTEGTLMASVIKTQEIENSADTLSYDFEEKKIEQTSLDSNPQESTSLVNEEQPIALRQADPIVEDAKKSAAEDDSVNEQETNTSVQEANDASSKEEKEETLEKETSEVSEEKTEQKDESDVQDEETLEQEEIESEPMPLLALDENYTAPTTILNKLMAVEATEKSEETAEDEEEEEIEDDGIVRASINPDFSNLEIWQSSESPYHQLRLWGQCTWFAWARFYEIYGYSPGFRGSGYQCASQLAAAHPDKFELSSTPKAGAVFSLYNHTGIVVSVSEDSITIQDGNLDGVTNYDWNTAINDWRTITLSWDQFHAYFGYGVTFANPMFEVVIE